MAADSLGLQEGSCLLVECFHHTLDLSVVIHWAQILALAIGQAR